MNIGNEQTVGRRPGCLGACLPNPEDLPARWSASQCVYRYLYPCQPLIDADKLAAAFESDSCVKSQERDVRRYPSSSQRNWRTMPWLQTWMTQSSSSLSSSAENATAAASRAPGPPSTSSSSSSVGGGPVARALNGGDPQRQHQWWYVDEEMYSVKGPSGMREYGPDIPEGAVPVAVVDVGFKLNHEDLENRWFDETPEKTHGSPDACFNGADDDGNGYVDDCGGEIFTDEGAWAGSHGTEVSGCIAGEADNGIGVTGVCPFCKVLPLRFDGFVSRELEALNYAAAIGVRVINLSFGGPE
eukprot:GHVU01032308.1.p1 GENE.GHVU01032308.1~~GHVU01032308.1.p1  ORF type:complete len:300 (+),score=48.60 GHVU01032308.1:294-1193(+)